MELSYFFSSILGAFTLYMLLRKPLFWLKSKGWNDNMATAFLLTVTILFVFVVGGALIGTIYSKLTNFHPQNVIDSFNKMHHFILAKTGYDVLSKEMVDKAIRTVSQMLPSIFSITGGILTNALMMIFILYFMLKSGKKMESSLESNLPLSGQSVSLLKHETQNMIVSNAIGIPLIMLGQGLTGALAYWFLDAGDPFVCGLLTGIAGLIPVIGTAGVWAILAANLLISGQIWQAIALVIYGILIITNVDNVVRIVFLQKKANVHPLITIFGVLLGMNIFGFWGIIFGPLMISGTLLLFRIYKTEFLEK